MSDTTAQDLTTTTTVDNKAPNVDVDKLTKIADQLIHKMKNETLLTVVNILFDNINHQHVDKLTDFTDINRDFLISDENTKTFIALEKAIYRVFDKSQTFYNKKSKKYVINSLKSLVKQLNLKIEYETKDLSTTVDGTIQKKVQYLYSIKPL